MPVNEKNERKLTEAEVLKYLESIIDAEDMFSRNTFQGAPLSGLIRDVIDLIKLKNEELDALYFTLDDLLEVIQRRNAKIERLNFENLQMIASIKNLKAEAIKEFAERVKMEIQRSVDQYCSADGGGYYLAEDVIDLAQIAKETKFFCDHCGKEINAMNDYIGEIIWDEIEADLCGECLADLNEIILQFLEKRGKQK